jgi:hypothetical protein
MPTQWKVTHFFHAPIGDVSGPLEYPKLSAKVALNEDGKASHIEHWLNVEDSLASDDVVVISTEALGLLLDAIAFISAQSAEGDKRAERVRSSELEAVASNFKTITGTALIACPLRLPKEESLVSSRGRLHVWIRLAMESRLPASSIEAIRNYAMIMEDMFPGEMDDEAWEFRHVRDFVSHAEVDNDSVCRFLDRKLKKGTRRYDPTDAKHLALVEEYREIGRGWVEGEVKSRLC